MRNYLKVFEDGHTEATVEKPSFGEVSATGDYYVGGLWYDKLGVVYPTQFTYLSKDDKLASFLIEGGQPVDITYEDDAPSIVQNVIQAKDIKATGEFKGKNACTAWVNFDGTTTPPTIRDSYNVSSVVRLGTGIYDVYFETDMDNVNYSSVATNNISSTGVSSNKLDNFIHKVTLTTSKYNATSSATINSVHILGGRNNA